MNVEESVKLILEEQRELELHHPHAAHSSHATHSAHATAVIMMIVSGVIGLVAGPSGVLRRADFE
jgi:hypothetical protein